MRATSHKFLLLLIFGVLRTAFLYAQEIEIKGRVTFEGRPVPNTHVIAKLPNGIGFVADSTNREGKFSFGVDGRWGTITLTARNAFYESAPESFIIKEGIFITLKLDRPKVNLIDSVAITAPMGYVKHHADRTVFDIENNELLNGGTVLEGISKLPGMLTLASGEIVYNGKMLKVFMNGEPINLTGEQLSSFLNSYPTHMVKSIEAIETPGAKYKASSGGGIINIVTKRNNRPLTGISGNLSQQNRLNDELKNTTSLNLILKSGKVSLSTASSISANRSNNRAAYRYALPKDMNSVREDMEISRRPKNILSHNILQYDISRSANANLTYLYNNHRDDRSTEGHSIRTFSGQEEEHDQQIDNRTSSSNHDVQAVFRQNLDTLGTKLVLTGRGRFNDRKRDNITYLNRVENSNYSTSTPEKSLLLKMDFEKKLRSLRADLETGVYLEDDKTEGSGKMLSGNLQPYLPYAFRYKNRAGYVSVSRNLRPLMYSIGLRMESIDFRGSLPTIDSISTSYNATRLFPSANLRYQVIPGVSARLGYNKRMQLPDLE